MRVSRERLSAMERLRRVECGQPVPEFAPRKFVVVPSARKARTERYAVVGPGHRNCVNCDAKVSASRLFCRPCLRSCPPELTTFQRTRWFVIQAYGGKCACCGEARIPFLAIDHINGGGNKHRKAIKLGGNVALWLARNRMPPGYRILCHNCNLARGFYGFCPHETERAQDESSAG